MVKKAKVVKLEAIVRGYLTGMFNWPLHLENCVR